jgi:hypothetical protein
MNREGPCHVVTHSCHGCKWLSGNPERQYPNYECKHNDARVVTGPGSLQIKGYIGQTCITPWWCPYCPEGHGDE